MSESPHRDEHLRIPRRTTPTWEIELLLSGALVFSLFSLREPLEEYFTRSMPVATKLMQPLVVYSYLYAKLVLFVLLITFVLHLAARARWVALVGVHSIYPKGPQWDHLSGGPLARRLIERDAGGSVEDAIERADNLSSLVFGYGILAAQLSLMIMLMSLVLFGLIAILRLFGLSDTGELYALIGLGAFLILPTVLDKYLVSRIGTAHWISRSVEGWLRISFALSLSRLQQPLNSLLTTNLGGKRGTWVLVGVIYAVLGLATFDTYLRLDRMQMLRGKALAQSERDFGLLPTHYADSRDGALRFSSIPFIESAVIEGPYLRLSIPYLPSRHDPLLAEHCPLAPLDPALEGDARHDALRQAQAAQANCFGALFKPRLNGAPLQDIEFHRFEGLDDAPDGVMAMIDVRGLPNGRHTLALEHVDARSANKDVASAGPRPHLIEFWR